MAKKKKPKYWVSGLLLLLVSAALFYMGIKQGILDERIGIAGRSRTGTLGGVAHWIEGTPAFVMGIILTGVAAIVLWGAIAMFRKQGGSAKGGRSL